MPYDNLASLVRLPAVLALVGLSRTQIYRLMSAGQFPTPVRISARSIAWRMAELIAWIETRPSSVHG
jgi:prophage regulatory protein